MTEFLCTLKNPSNEYRGHPFWSWNDKLEPEELRRQIRSMRDVGLGGFFMHARGGLETEYLSEDWFNCIKACVDEGKKTGMEAWSYDEDGWPSGFAGGLVTALGDEYHVRNLVCEEVKGDFEVKGEALGYYAVSGSGHYRCFGEDLGTARMSLGGGDRLYCVSHVKNPYYVDLLNPKVVRKFIDLTYERYSKELGEDFGGASMPGFFTDEPQFARCLMPWSYVLPEEFEKTNGYSCMEHLICLFLDVLGSEKLRYDFWQVVSRLYTESFGKQIFDWCNEHNCKFTGHAMMEDNLLAQMYCTGGVMPLYQYMHVPGIDWLCRGIASPIIPKQVGSAARQLGKKHVLTEIFALCGWDVTPEEMKWMVEWQFVNGVNLVCAHLEGYTIRGLRKRDYPATLFEQLPWWNDYKLFNDYISRLGKLLADGDEAVDTLLIHPLHSAWITYNGQNNDNLARLDKSFLDSSNALSGEHILYHYGDEAIMKNSGGVENGRLVVGSCSYKYVVLPALETLDENTFSLLVEFAEAGGKIFALDGLPYRINGRFDSRLRALNDRIIQVPADRELRDKLFVEYGLKRISISGRGGENTSIHCCERRFDDGENGAYFFINLDREHACDVKITLPTSDPTVGYRLETLDAYDLDKRADDGKTEVLMHFEPMQSALILRGRDIPDVMKHTREALPLKLSDDWTIESASEKTDLNCLTLDYCQYAIGNGEGFNGFGDKKPVLGVMDELLANRANSPIKLRYSFHVSDDFDAGAERELYLVTEFDDEWKIEVNGHEVRHDLTSWWKDRTFKKINIAGRIINGENEIVVTGAFAQKQKVYDVLFGENVLETERNKLTYDTEIESVYLLGRFGVYSETGYTEGERRALFTDGGFTLTEPNYTLCGGEITEQGWPFFAGRMTISQEVEISDAKLPRRITFSKPYSAVAKLSINDKPVKTFIWADYSADVTGYLREGVNKISFELVTGNRNLLGPHHNPQGESYAVSPGSFGPNGDYSANSWRDRYCFVKAGWNK